MLNNFLNAIHLLRDLSKIQIQRSLSQKCAFHYSVQLSFKTYGYLSVVYERIKTNCYRKFNLVGQHLDIGIKVLTIKIISGTSSSRKMK